MIGSLLKSLLVVCALGGTVSSGVLRTYDLRATVISGASDDLPTCGAAERMLRDKHILTFDDDWNVSVNGFRWNVQGSSPGGLDISFHDGNGQWTYLTMELIVDDHEVIGRYSLFGILPYTDRKAHREICVDRVQIYGRRR